MSVPISPTDGQGQVPQAPVLASPPSGARSSDGTVQRPAASEAAQGSQAAAELQLSAQAQAQAQAASKLQQQEGIKPMDVADAAKAFQEYLKNLPSDLQFEPDAASGIVVFKVINPITQKVLRQYPPDEVLAMARSIKQSLKDASGILLDKHL